MSMGGTSGRLLDIAGLGARAQSVEGCGPGGFVDIAGISGQGGAKQVHRMVSTPYDLRRSRVRDILFVAFVAFCSRIRTLTEGNEGNEVGNRTVDRETRVN
jgi:hypothetical protein